MFFEEHMLQAKDFNFHVRLQANNKSLSEVMQQQENAIPKNKLRQYPLFDTEPT